MLANPPGIEDVFPDRAQSWSLLLSAVREVFRLYNYREIIIPVIEYTEVFARGLGDSTDIVSKEMFSFDDRGGRSLTLRPEGTASVVRAYVSNGEYNRRSIAKLYYCGPMFRAERPQRGRLRQFNQFGAECFGSGDPYYDFEIIAMMDAISKRAGITGYGLLINSIGCPECRGPYLEELRRYYSKHVDRLCEDCVRRLSTNALRLLDCKQEGCIALRNGAPLITAFLDPDCAAHHEAVKALLTRAGIAFVEDPHLVRGLDYYTRTTYEFVSSSLGGQNAFAAGGRYDSLVEVFGGKPTPAVGFAAGIERMLLLIDRPAAPPRLDVYLVHTGGEALAAALRIAGELRAAGLSADIEPQSTGFKSQFKKADRERARFCCIIAGDELASGNCTLKDMDSGAQERIPRENCVAFLRKRLSIEL